MNPIRISKIQLSSKTDAELSATIDGLPSCSRGERLWFRFPAEFFHSIREGGEPFLAALLPIAMSLRQPISIDGMVSEQLLAGCRHIMSLYRTWDRRLKTIELRAPVIRREEAGSAIGCFFTGGVDSFYSVLKNLKHESRGSRISHLLFIRGYTNCPLENESLFGRLYTSLQRVAINLNMKLLVISTNLRAFIPPAAAGWDWYAGSLLAAPALCLAPVFRRILIPSGDTYWTLSPWGSHPLIDPLWSTETLEFVHDGCEASRSQKLERYITGSNVALNHLRVCDYDQSGSHNCGNCEKCLRTMIALRALQVEFPPSLFAQPLDINQIRRLDGGQRVTGYYLRDNLQLLQCHAADAELQAAVCHALRADPLRWASRQARATVQELDRRLLKGRIRSWVLAEAARAAQDSEVRASPLRWAISHLWRSQINSRGPAEAKEEDPCL